jgi:hypothetical protein
VSLELRAIPDQRALGTSPFISPVANHHALLISRASSSSFPNLTRWVSFAIFSHSVNLHIA